MPRKLIRTKPQEQWFTAGPLVGMRDAPQPGTPAPDRAFDVRNMCRQPGPQGTGLVGRPGFGVLGEVTDAPQSLGTLVQAVLTWTDAVGVRITTACVDGTLWTYNWSSDVWTNAVTAANLATASVTLSTSAPQVSLVPFAGRLMVSDGVNALVTWTGATGAGGVAQVPGVGPFFGPMDVYYGKLAGILAADAGAGPRKTLVWSEENDETLGYNLAPYNNAWDNPGAYTEPLTGLAATNEALFVFRERRVIAIQGAINEDFQTAGTRGFSEEIGTASPWAIRVIDQGVLFVDQTGAVHLAQLGALGPVPLWDDAVRVTRSTPRQSLLGAVTVRDGATESLLVGLPIAGSSLPYLWLCYDERSLAFVGVWSWDRGASCAGEVVDGDGVDRWAHAAGGMVFGHGTLGEGPLWDDPMGTGAQVAIPHRVTGPLQGYDLHDELRIDALEVSVPACTASSVALSYSTPRGETAPQTVPLFGTSGGGFVLDVSALDIGLLGGVSATNRKGMARTFGRGRGVQMTVQHAAVGESFAVDVLRVRTYRTTGNNQAP